MLISHSSLILFVTGAAVLLVIPGPAVTYVVSRSIGHGRAAGLVSLRRKIEVKRIGPSRKLLCGAEFKILLKMRL